MEFTADDSDICPELSLNNTITDNILFQRGKPVVIKGESKFLDNIVVTLTNDNDASDTQTKQIPLNGKFSWETELNAVTNYTDTYTLKIIPTPVSEATEDCPETIEIKNIMFGDVYLLAGQSNMVVEASYYKNMGIDFTSEQLGIKHKDIRCLDYTDGRCYFSEPSESYRME